MRRSAALQQGDLEKLASSGFDPKMFRSYTSSDRFSGALDALAATAPSEIAADVKTDNEWENTRKVEVLEKFGYDLRRILLEGSAEDLAVITDWDPAIRKQDSRITAYQEQVCGG